MIPATENPDQLLQTYFPGFEPELRELILQNGSIKKYEAGDVLIRPGQYFRSVMLVLEGRIKLYREGEEGNEFFMYYIQPGEACALSMICASRQETSEVLAKATEDSLVVAVPIQLMDSLMQKYRSWYYFVLETYRSRYEELLGVIDAIAFRNMDERLEFYLSKQAKTLNTDVLNLTHQQIANDLNSSREVISRLLKKMEGNGMIELQRNAIHIKYGSGKR
jgi:CRP/FNR family transcriptional regulator